METNPTESISALFHSFNRLSTSFNGGLRSISSPIKTSVSKPALSVLKKPAYLLLMPFSSLIKVKCDELYCDGKRALPNLRLVSCEICFTSDLFKLSIKKTLKRFPGNESSLVAASAEGRLLE